MTEGKRKDLSPWRRPPNRLVDARMARMRDVVVPEKPDEGGRATRREHLFFLDDSRKGETLVATYAVLASLDPGDPASQDGRRLGNIAAYRQRFVALAPRPETQA